LRFVDADDALLGGPAAAHRVDRSPCRRRPAGLAPPPRGMSRPAPGSAAWPTTRAERRSSPGKPAQVALGWEHPRQPGTDSYRPLLSRKDLHAHLADPRGWPDSSHSLRWVMLADVGGRTVPVAGLL
jgi:hypothetical protein